jgi:hypothetical protein
MYMIWCQASIIKALYKTRPIIAKRDNMGVNIMVLELFIKNSRLNNKMT